jgi:hypothetical protein
MEYEDTSIFFAPLEWGKLLRFSFGYVLHSPDLEKGKEARREGGKICSIMEDRGLSFWRIFSA